MWVWEMAMCFQGYFLSCVNVGIGIPGFLGVGCRVFTYLDISRHI